MSASDTTALAHNTQDAFSFNESLSEIDERKQNLTVKQDTDNDISPSVSPGTLRYGRVDELKEFDRDSQSADSDYSHEETSDAEVLAGEFEPPSDELKERIIAQIEFYFSDANILHDKFLLKHVKRNKHGYVSLKLITSFRKMKSLTKDYRVVAYSLQESANLEVNKEGNKVRRRAPLPDHDETAASRTVVVSNLPMQEHTVESVAELFSKCDEIALIRIVRPSKSVPTDINKHLNKLAEPLSSTYAVIEFERYSAAKKACELMTNVNDWRRGMRVVMLIDAKKTEKEKNKTMPNDKNNVDTDDQDDVKGSKKQKSRLYKLARERNSASVSSGSDGDLSETKTGGYRETTAKGVTYKRSLSPQRDPHKLNPFHSAHSTPRSTPLSSPKSSPKTSPRTSPGSRRRNPPGKSPLAMESKHTVSPGQSPEGRPRSDSAGIIQTGGTSQSPWVQRRMKAQQESAGSNNSSPGGSPLLSRKMADASSGDHLHARREGIIREPKGPDGTRGFHFPRSHVHTIMGRAHLRSADRGELAISRVHTCLGCRSFPVSGRTVWNSLSPYLRSSELSRNEFKRLLKTCYRRNKHA